MKSKKWFFRQRESKRGASGSADPLRSRLRTEEAFRLSKRGAAQAAPRSDNQRKAVKTWIGPNLNRTSQKSFYTSLPHYAEAIRLFPSNASTAHIRRVLKKLPKSVCQKRHERRSVLFSMNIAGKQLKKSPGSGGSYKRRRESLMPC